MGESMAIFPDEVYRAKQKRATSSCHIYNYLNQGYMNSNINMGAHDESVVRTSGGQCLSPHPPGVDCVVTQGQSLTPEKNHNISYHQDIPTISLSSPSSYQPNQYQNCVIVNCENKYDNNNLLIPPALALRTNPTGTGCLAVDRPGSPMVVHRSIVPEEITLENNQQLPLLPYLATLEQLSGRIPKGRPASPQVQHWSQVSSDGHHHKVRPDSPIVHKSLLQQPEEPLDPEVFVQDPVSLAEAGRLPTDDTSIRNLSNNQDRSKRPVPDLIENSHVKW